MKAHGQTLARQKNLSQEQIKIRILSYLYNREEGSNAHNIQFHAVPGHTQEASRFKRLLDELCALERIREIDMSHVTKGRVIYKITDKGRETIIHLRNPPILKFAFNLLICLFSVPLFKKDSS